MNLISKLLRLVRTVRADLFSIFQIALIGLLVVLVVIFVVVLFSENPEWIFNLLGIAQNGESKYEVLKFLGIGMGGILIALQALMSYKRAKALEKTAEAQADAAKAQADAVLKTEQGQRQERLKNAIEHLGNESDSVRLGGAYELFHLAQDTEELRQTVLDILCAHIRQTTGESEYREAHKSKPSEEVQSLLALLFVQKHEVFKGCHINLQGSWLNGANLQRARLERAILNGAYLQEADLSQADLQEADLSTAHMQGADLCHIHLRGADLNDAGLQRTLLCGAQLQGTFLGNANLQDVNFVEARLEWADLSEAHLQGAYFLGAHLQGVTRNQADLRGAQIQESRGPTFAKSMRNLVDIETEFSHVIFEGGLSQVDVDSFVEEIHYMPTTIWMRSQLEPHIGKPPSYTLPEDSGAIIGSYTEEEAEEWIAEYKEAMAEVPGNDS